MAKAQRSRNQKRQATQPAQGATTAPPRRPPPAASSTRNRNLLLGVGALVVLGAAAAALVLGQGRGPSPTAGPTLFPGSTAPSASTTLPVFVATANDPAVGMRAPEVTGSDFDGQPVTLAAQGQAQIVLFLAHWCPHCQREVPVVQDWLDAGGLPEGVQLLSVATSIDPNAPNYPPDAWLEREGWQPPVLVDADESVARSYGLASFPYWVAIDSDGSVAMRTTGELTPEQLDAMAGVVE